LQPSQFQAAEQYRNSEDTDVLEAAVPRCYDDRDEHAHGQRRDGRVPRPIARASK
jgi:hypothetical protein